MVPYITLISAFVISFISTPIAMLLAQNSGAIAIPGKRHIHSKPTPKFGGFAIALGVMIVSPFIITIDREIGSYLAAASVMFLLGLVDDVRGTHWNVKLLCSIIATSIIIFGTGMWIKSLGNLLGFGEIQLGIWGIPFTYFAVFGVINAVNLIDGLDGLACGVASIAFLSFAILASTSGNETVFYLSMANLGATLGMFKYNYPKAKIFMGDSGSMFLGFSLAILAIFLTQGHGNIDPMVPVLILGIPIFDTLRVLFIRIRQRRHPFAADKTHLHHLMIRSGIPRQRVVKTLWVSTALMSSLAFILMSSEGWLMFVIFLIISSLLGLFISNLRVIKSTNARNGKNGSNGKNHHPHGNGNSKSLI